MSWGTVGYQNWYKRMSSECMYIIYSLFESGYIDLFSFMFYRNSRNNTHQVVLKLVWNFAIRKFLYFEKCCWFRVSMLELTFCIRTNLVVWITIQKSITKHSQVANKFFWFKIYFQKYYLLLPLFQMSWTIRDLKSERDTFDYGFM